MSFPLLGAILLLTQVPPDAGGPPARTLEALRSDEIGVREDAVRALGALPAAAMPALREFIAAEGDPEVRERAAEGLRRIAVREAERDLAEGRLHDALRALAAVDEHADLDAAVARTRDAVSEEIRGWFPCQPEMDDCPHDYAEAAREIRERFDLWGTAALLDLLTRPNEHVPAAALLLEMDDEIVPTLAAGVRGGSLDQRREFCGVLHARAIVRGRALRDEHGLGDSLRVLAEDPAQDPGTRQRCLELLDQLRVAR